MTILEVSKSCKEEKEVIYGSQSDLHFRLSLLFPMMKQLIMVGRFLFFLFFPQTLQKISESMSGVKECVCLH